MRITSSAKTIEEFRTDIVSLLNHRAEMYAGMQRTETSKKRRAELETAKLAIEMLATDITEIVVE